MAVLTFTSSRATSSLGGVAGPPNEPVPAARVVILAGPSGSGKSHLAARSGLPVVRLDDFYKNGDDPSLPRQTALGIVDWDDIRAWDRDYALSCLGDLCRTGAAQLPVYDIGSDSRVSTRKLNLDGGQAFIAEGLFAADIVAEIKAAGLLAAAIVLHRHPAKNFIRRLSRDLYEHRKPPRTLVQRGWTLMRAERALNKRLIALGCEPMSYRQASAYLATLAPKTA